jgi:PAS domain-containing protein
MLERLYQDHGNVNRSQCMNFFYEPRLTVTRSEMIEHREPSNFTQSGDFFTEISCFPSDKIGAWLLAIIESTMDGVIVLDATRQLVLFNCEAERIFGYTAKELLGKPLDISGIHRFEQFQSGC